MNKPILLQGIGIAAVLALTAIPGIHLLRPLLNEAAAIRAMSMLLGLAYLGYLLSQSRAKAGKISLAAMSLVLLIGAPAAGISATGLIILATALIWAVRSLMAYTSFVSAALDCLLNLASLASAYGAYGLSGSFTAAVWCFFLTQALFVLIPQRLKRRKHMDNTDTTDDRFARAHRSAEAVLHARMRKTAE